MALSGGQHELKPGDPNAGMSEREFVLTRARDLYTLPYKDWGDPTPDYDSTFAQLKSKVEDPLGSVQAIAAKMLGKKK